MLGLKRRSRCQSSVCPGTRSRSQGVLRVSAMARLRCRFRRVERRCSGKSVGQVRVPELELGLVQVREPEQVREQTS